MICKCCKEDADHYWADQFGYEGYCDDCIDFLEGQSPSVKREIIREIEEE